jgi:hypothetical protein
MIALRPGAAVAVVLAADQRRLGELGVEVERLAIVAQHLAARVHERQLVQHFLVS